MSRGETGGHVLLSFAIAVLLAGCSGVPAPTPTPSPTAAATIRPFGDIINPDPSDKPQSPVTGQQMEDAFYAYSTANIAGEYTSAEIAVINKRATRCAVSSKQLSEDQYLSQRSDCEAALFYALAEAMVNTDQLAWHSAFETYWYTLGPNGLGNVTSPSSETIKQYFDKDISSCKFVFEGICSPVAVPS